MWLVAMYKRKIKAIKLGYSVASVIFVSGFMSAL